MRSRISPEKLPLDRAESELRDLDEPIASAALGEPAAVIVSEFRRRRLAVDPLRVGPPFESANRDAEPLGKLRRGRDRGNGPPSSDCALRLHDLVLPVPPQDQCRHLGETGDVPSHVAQESAQPVERRQSRIRAEDAVDDVGKGIVHVGAGMTSADEHRSTRPPSGVESGGEIVQEVGEGPDTMETRRGFQRSRLALPHLHGRAIPAARRIAEEPPSSG